MSVPGVSRNEAECEERVERAPERVAADAESPGEGRESRPLLPEKLREDGRRPAVVKEGDQVRD
jgi:hypothetical protein